uniref:Ribonuclease A-domain domain-containing protein n=1 Tax=Leptobrachium leishanense TaxID=445787 RepID=A0A8C5PR78_9ANUR
MSLSALVMLGILLSFSAHGYANFRNDHIVVNQTNITCRDIEERRNITNDHGNCKEWNTFIHTTNERDITNLCNGRNRNRDGVLSHNTFPLTECHVTLDGAFPNCRFNQTKLKEQICVKCVNSWPVHYYSRRENITCTV